MSRAFQGGVRSHVAIIATGLATFALVHCTFEEESPQHVTGKAPESSIQLVERETDNVLSVSTERRSTEATESLAALPSPSPATSQAMPGAPLHSQSRRSKSSVGYGGGRRGRQPVAANHQAGERYSHTKENSFVAASEDSKATFSLDVDTASYTLMRRDLQTGTLPSPQAIRVEELINFFDYDDEPPSVTDDAPFNVHLESAPSPFGDGMNLLRVAVQAVEVPEEQRPDTNLIFLIDVSGSMSAANKLPLVQYAMTTLVNTLRPTDSIGIVVYAGRQAVVLQPTQVAERGAILDAIRNLQAGGSTNGEAGIRTAYDLATRSFKQGGINRVILCTDGDFNVGVTGDALITLIEQYRERGVTLTTLGFGRGNYNDRDMERLADHGNGNYAYIDNRNEALRVLGRDLGGTLQVIAKDVKVQVNFDSSLVTRFRLIGYENRVLAHQDFENDAIDAAEIGSGQFITAFIEYELRPGVSMPSDARNLASVRVRFKAPDGDRSMEVSHNIRANQVHASFDSASPVFRFGTAVAEFAEILRRSEHSQGARFDDVERIARSANWSSSGDAGEFLELISMARSRWGN